MMMMIMMMILRNTVFHWLIGWLVGWLVGLGPKFLDNGSQPSLNGSPRNLHTSLVWSQALKSTFENFSPHL